MHRTLSTALATLALAACGGNAAGAPPDNKATPAGAPAPATAHKLTLTYFTMTG